MKLKKQTGITLIALVITIVVLLILAAVAITAITEYNIIGNANSAAEKYENKAGEENTVLKNYDQTVGEYIGGSNGETDSEGGEGNEGSTEEELKEITFTIEGVEYKAIDGWLWSIWVESKYNTANAYINSEFGSIIINGREILDKFHTIEGEEYIEANGVYILSDAGAPE